MTTSEKLISIIESYGIKVVASVGRNYYDEYDKNEDLKMKLAIKYDLSDVDLKESYDTRIAIIYDEAITTDNMIYFHNWLMWQSADIRNVVMVFTHTVNLEKWYREYCAVMQYVPMKIIDAPQLAYWYDDLGQHTYTGSIQYAQDNYGQYFGGTKTNVSNDVKALMIQDSKYIDAEYAAGLDADHDKLLNHLEVSTNWVDQELCDKIVYQYNITQYNQSKTNRQRSEVINRVQELAQSVTDNHTVSPLLIVRETLDKEPFLIETEKTTLPFAKMQIPLFMGYNAVSVLEDRGFIFLHDIVDYSYSTEPHWINRIKKMLAEVDRIANKYTVAELIAKMQDYLDILEQNRQCVLTENLTESAQSLVEQKLKKLTK